jgi:hypothetical protein
MPLKNGGHWEERFFRDLSALPLPGAAVVIDVRDERYCDERAAPLIEHLAIELEDLAAEMRLNQVARWRYLADCIELLRTDTIPPDARQDEYVDIKLTTRTGKQISIQGRNDLVKTIGRGYIDRVRNQHIKAVKDNGPDEEELRTSRVDPEQPTVRVFFLTDMEDKDSLERASTYAHWLKEWIHEQHGERLFSRDERISTITLCLNAPASGQEAILRSLGGWLPEERDHVTALDTVILIQEYRDDAAYIGGEAQIYQAELILYTLLLHWPEILKTDAQNALYHLDEVQNLPWPTYTMGIAALEYSARWGARWLDYGLAVRALEMIRDVKKVDNEQKALRPGVQCWFDAWLTEVQAVVPRVLNGTVLDIEGLALLQRFASRSPFRSNSLRQAQGELQRYTDEVRQLYAPAGPATLQLVIDSAPFMLDQVRQSANDPVRNAELQEASTQLTGLYIRAQKFIDDNFREAWGAVPRALSQIALLRESMSELRRTKQNPPNIETMRGQVEREVADVNKRLLYGTRTWRIPVVGELFPSTVFSLAIAFVLFLVLWNVLGNAAFLPAIFSRPLILGITALPVLCLLIVTIGEIVYLFVRNSKIRQAQQAMYRKLRDVLEKHSTEIGTFVAANAALALLEWADFFQPGEESSPYEERLKQLDMTLEAAQLAARKQQFVADQRLCLSLDQRPLKNSLEATWPNLNNRKDLLTWRRLEDAYLAASHKLENNFAPLNFLSEMLVRRVGTEKPEAILQSLLSEAVVIQSYVARTTVRDLLEMRGTQLPSSLPSTQSDEIRFQLLSTMLVGVLLTSDIVPLALHDVLPLIDRYSAEKDLFLTDAPVVMSEVLSLNEVVRDTMLGQTLRGDQAVTNFTLKTDVPAELVLASWVGQQRLFDAAFAESLEENDIVTLLEKREVTLDQALGDLRRKSGLAGYPDQMTGDDFFLLLLAPGWTSNAFIVNGGTHDGGPNNVKPILFPDAEKIVYLHIHRLRQLLPGKAVVLK